MKKRRPGGKRVIGVPEARRRQKHYQRTRARYRVKHPVIAIVEGRSGRELSAEELRK